MKLRWLCCLLLGIAACAMPRPEGSWEPPEEDAEADDADAQVDEFDRTPSIDDEDARVDAPSRDAATDEPARDGDASDDDDDTPDTGEVVSGHPLAALDGKRFLMRMDLYSRVTTTSPVALEVKNRVSNLLWVKFSLEGETLTSTEVLCDQQYAHECERGCDDWTTRVHPTVIEDFFTNRDITRTYEFDSASRELSGRSSMPLGFDEAEDERSVPTDESDSRVWKIGSEGFGVYTDIDVTGLPLRMTLDCKVSSVQRFQTTVSGELPDSMDLESTMFELDTTGSDGAVVYVAGVPTRQCTKDNLENQDADEEASKVRFKAYDGDRCPTDFDALLPANPAFMF